MLSTQVEWPDDTEILLADMPPSTASEVFSFFDNMAGLLGCLFVTQPSGISVLGMRNTVYSLRLQKVPTTETMRRGYSPFTPPRRPPIVLADMPPSTASEVFSFFDNMESLLGCIIVTQPSEISALGMTRTIDFLRHKGIPIIGLVSMMDGYLCPDCGKVSHLLLPPKLAMEKGSQGLRGAALDIHSANSGCGAIGGVTRLSARPLASAWKTRNGELT